MPGRIALQLEQYNVNFVVPEGSERRGHDEYRAYFVLPGERPRIAYGDILSPYSRINEIDESEFAEEIAEKPTTLNMEFSDECARIGCAAIRLPLVSPGHLDSLDMNGYPAKHLRLSNTDFVGERYMIWLADDSVCDLFFYYTETDSEMGGIIRQIIDSLRIG